MRSVAHLLLLLLALPACELASGVDDYYVDEEADCAYMDAVLADGPSAYWRLDDAKSSATAHDELQVRPGDRQGGSFGAAGLVGCDGTALDVSDAGGQVVVGDHFAFEANAPFTVEAWVRRNPGAGDVVSRRDGADAGWMLRITNVGTLAMIRLIGFTFFEGAESQVLPDGPVYVAGRYDPAEGACVFINGIKNGCAQAPTPIARAQTPFIIGANGYSGVVDEVAVYERALTDEQLRAHFSAANP